VAAWLRLGAALFPRVRTRLPTRHNCFVGEHKAVANSGATGERRWLPVISKIPRWIEVRCRRETERDGHKCTYSDCLRCHKYDEPEVCLVDHPVYDATHRGYSHWNSPLPFPHGAIVAESSTVRKAAVLPVIALFARERFSARNSNFPPLQRNKPAMRSER
jgi:hypothetical protein